MPTALYYNDEFLPPIGTVVTIKVNSANHPTGNWLGVIDSYIGPETTLRPGEKWVMCEVMLTDPNLSDEWCGKSPSLNSTAYVETQGTCALRVDLNTAKKEIAALRKRLDLERDMFHGLMRALIGSTGLENLKIVLKDFIESARKK
jgi:hypothetical protein